MIHTSHITGLLVKYKTLSQIWWWTCFILRLLFFELEWSVNWIEIQRCQDCATCNSIAKCVYTMTFILYIIFYQIYQLFAIPLSYIMFLAEYLCNYSWQTATNKIGLVMKATSTSSFGSWLLYIHSIVLTPSSWHVGKNFQGKHN